jgi:GNAT superfamily N-acetyltransferase
MMSPMDTARSEHQVRLAVASDIDELLDSLVDAFFTDPITTWVYPDETKRRPHLTEWYRLCLLAGLRCGHTYTVSHNRACAVWAPPSVPHLFEWQREGIQIAEMLDRQLGTRSRPVIDGLTGIEVAHPHVVPHFYLSMLGTAPQAQGRGLAGALLKDVLGRCDSDGWPAYLETSRERNVLFYEARGFRVTGETSLPEGPPVWFMWRDAQ